MSITIYDGLAIKAKSLDEAIELINKKKPLIKKIVEQSELESSVYIAINTLVDYLLFSENSLKPYINKFVEERFSKDEFNGKFNALFHSKNKPEEKEELSLVLFPTKVQIKKENHYLVMLYLPRMLEKKIKPIFEDLLIDYGYWDNTDWPEGMTEKEWSEREKNWDKSLLSKSGVPSIEGLTCTLCETSIIDLMPTQEKISKIEKICNELKDYKNFTLKDKEKDLIVRYISNKIEEMANSGTKMDIYEGFKNFKTLKARISTNELSEQENQWKDEIVSILNKKMPDKISIDLLLEPFNTVKDNIKKEKMNNHLNDVLNPKNDKKAPKI